MIKVSKYTTGIMQTNVYFAVNDDTKDCVIVDPGANGPKIIEILENSLKVHPVGILLTHGHFDHILAAEELSERFQIPIFAGEKEKDTLARPNENMSSQFGLEVSIQNYHAVKDGDVLDLCGENWKVIETPGHTEGGVTYFLENEGKPIAFTGDTLFSESFGRTDLPGGSEKVLFDSILNKLFLLPEDTMVYPGHESETMISHEKKYNPVNVLSKMSDGGFSF